MRPGIAVAIPEPCCLREKSHRNVRNAGPRPAARAGVITVNAALVRLFRLTERYRLETRFEAFNAVNHSNFNNPAVTLTSATFGRITAAGDPRILQFAMKLNF